MKKVLMGVAVGLSLFLGSTTAAYADCGELIKLFQREGSTVNKFENEFSKAVEKLDDSDVPMLSGEMLTVEDTEFYQMILTAAQMNLQARMASQMVADEFAERMGKDKPKSPDENTRIFCIPD